MDIPLSNISGDAGSEIGDLRFDTERGSKFTRNGRTWAMAGTVYPAASYPRAAVDAGTMVNGLTSTLPGNVNVSGWATNGTGTIVAAYGDSTNLIVTTNNGQSWAYIAHNLGIAATDVVYNAGSSKFVAVGNSATQIIATSSTSGSSTWTLGGTASVTSAVADTARAACDGTNVLIVCQAGSTSAAATTSNGATLTARTLASSGGGIPVVCVLPSLGATRWIVAHGGQNGSQSSTSGATAFSAITLPNGTGNPVGLAGGNGVLVIFNSNSQTYYTSTTGATGSWTARGIPGFGVSGNTGDNFAPFSAIRCNWVSFDGTYFITGTATPNQNPQGVFGYSSDGIDWSVRQLTYPGTTTNRAVATISANGYLVGLPTGASTTDGAQYSSAWLTTCNYVGKARPINSLGASLSNNTMQLTGYVRID